MALSLNETRRVKQWLYEIISSNLTIVQAVGRHEKLGVIQIYDKVAPEGAAFPYVTFQFMPEADKRGGFGARLFCQGAFIVKAVNRGTDAEPLWDIADAFDGDLQDASAMVTSTGLIVMGCTRDLLHDQSTVDSGVQYNEVGGRYAVQFYLEGESVPGQSDAVFVPPSLTVQAQLDVLSQKIEELTIMAYNPVPQMIPQVPITGNVTLSLPAQDTRYPVNITANAVITLPAAPGGGRKLYFDFDNLSTFAASFALNGSDGYVTPLPPIVTGATFALVSNSAGKWSIE